MAQVLKMIGTPPVPLMNNYHPVHNDECCCCICSDCNFSQDSLADIDMGEMPETPHALCPEQSVFRDLPMTGCTSSTVTWSKVVREYEYENDLYREVAQAWIDCETKRWTYGVLTELWDVMAEAWRGYVSCFIDGDGDCSGYQGGGTVFNNGPRCFGNNEGVSTFGGVSIHQT